MLLLPVLLVASFWSCGDAQAIPVQTPELVTRMERSSASIECSMSSEDIVHWYHQRAGQPPKRILYVSGQSPTFDDSSSSRKYNVQKDSSEPRYTLIIAYLTPKDSGLYYCAYWPYRAPQHQKGKWYADIKVFGSGTKLIVSDKANTAPKNHEILSSENENKLTYVCLIEKFYPEFIRVTWTEEEKEVTGDVVNGEVWKSADDEEYSIGSWLTVPKENINKKYYCKYEHESKKESLRIPSYHSKTDLTNTAEEQNCDAYFRNSTTFYGDHLMHRTAYLVYTVLLLKSSMYYLIVLFLVYKMRTPAKPYGK
ncbi:immunoglobulin kappa light chain-like [Rhea pennata]|uniref:immunoglobulin kappa light chain-like n=1 Tax=Rhea pennata TaxID=8795 RepID=UPI002E2690BD